MTIKSFTFAFALVAITSPLYAADDSANPFSSLTTNLVGALNPLSGVSASLKDVAGMTKTIVETPTTLSNNLTEQVSTVSETLQTLKPSVDYTSRQFTGATYNGPKRTPSTFSLK